MASTLSVQKQTHTDNTEVEVKCSPHEPHKLELLKISIGDGTRTTSTSTAMSSLLPVVYRVNYKLKPGQAPRNNRDKGKVT